MSSCIVRSSEPKLVLYILDEANSVKKINDPIDILVDINLNKTELTGKLIGFDRPNQPHPQYLIQF